MRLRERRRRMVCPRRLMRSAVDPCKRRNSRWRGTLAAIRRMSWRDPCEFEVDGYYHLVFGGVCYHGSFATS